MNFNCEIKGHILEYIEDGHIYLVDGVIVPSITEMLKVKFGNKYDFVSEDLLKRSAEYGTKIHEAVQKYCEDGEDDGSQEIRSFRLLQSHYGFMVLENEVPVILFRDGDPIGAGRLDLVLAHDGEIGGADIKSVSSLDKLYLFYQLNLYRIAYRQSYDIEWQFLKGIQLKEQKRKYVPIPINEDLAWELVDKFMEEHSEYY